MSRRKDTRSHRAKRSKVTELHEVLRDDKQWTELTEKLPPRLNEVAKQSGAVKRWRKIRSGAMLLRLALLYGFALMGLRTLCCWAARAGLCRMTDEALGYRLSRSVDFLGVVLAHVLQSQLNQRKNEPQLLGGVKMLLSDATVLTLPGSCGTDLRLHAGFVLPQSELAAFKLSGPETGERLDLLEPEAGTLVVGDMGLCHASGLHAVHERGAWFLTRMHPQNLRLESELGVPIDVDSILKRADLGEVQTEVLVPLDEHTPLRARLLVRRLSEQGAERARRKKTEAAKKKGRSPDELALRLCGYLWLLTNADQEQLSDEQAFSLYRLRWQIELAFKRYKGLLGLETLRKANTPLLRVQVLAKLIVIALAEQFIASQMPQLDLQSLAEAQRAETRRPPVSLWRLTQLASLALLASLAGPPAWWLRGTAEDLEMLRERKRKRGTHHLLFLQLSTDPQVIEIMKTGS